MIEPIQDFLERLDQEQQANRQAVKKLEKFKRDMDKLQVNFFSLKLPMILNAVVVGVSDSFASVVDVVSVVSVVNLIGLIICRQK